MERIKAFYLKYYSELIALFVFIVYLTTLAPSVVNIDSGELATVQITLGIAHPTGYPLFTMLGYLWQIIPLPFTAIFKANLLAAVFTSLAIWIFTKSTYLMLSNIPLQKPKNISKKKKKKIVQTQSANENQSNKPLLISSASASGLILAFSKTFWMQSTSVEVYSLHLFLINIVILFLLKAYFDKEGNNRNWFYVSVALALSFSNHMTTILILPGIAFLFYSSNRFSVNAIKLNLKMIAVFIPALLLIYLYLPIRSSQNPLLNWGHPVNFENFWRHFTGAQYRVWLFASSAAAKKQFAYFISNIPSEFSGSIAGLVILLGFVYSFKKFRKMFYFLLITFIATISYSINYDINDIDSYFLLAYISLIFISSFGFVYMYNLNKGKISNIAILVIFFLIPLVQMGLNYKEDDKSSAYIYKDYTKQILNSVPDNSLILSYQWDYWVSASYYFRLVENYRRDVTVIDKELLRRSWYYNQLESDYPGILDSMSNDVNGFLKALQPFERSEKFNPNLLEKYYKAIIIDLLITHKGDVFIAPELYNNEIRKGKLSIPDGYHLVPYNYLFLLTKKSGYIAAPELTDSIRFPKLRNKYSDVIEQTIINALSYRALYELNYGFRKKAKRIVLLLKKKFPKVRLDERLSGL